MGKAIATPKSNKKGPIIVKFWYNDVEPPKNYVWVRDDFYYIYQNHNWVPYEYEDLLPQLPVGCICEKVPTNSCNMQCSCIKYITSADLTDRLEKFQKELLAKIVKLINTSTSGDISVLDKYVKEQLEPRIEQLENNESNYLTSDALNGYATEQWVENKNYLTEHQPLNGYATEEFVNNAINSIEIPEPQVYDDTELRQMINDKELILSSSLNDLNDRIIAIESAGYATQNWVENNAAIPASNVTCNVSSDAFDFSNVNDGLIALVNRAEDLKNDITGVDSRISDLETSSINANELNTVKNEINKTIEDNELVISSAFNDLNDRMLVLENKA